MGVDNLSRSTYHYDTMIVIRLKRLFHSHDRLLSQHCWATPCFVIGGEIHMLNGSNAYHLHPTSAGPGAFVHCASINLHLLTV